MAMLVLGRIISFDRFAPPAECPQFVARPRTGPELSQESNECNEFLLMAEISNLHRLDGAETL